MIWALLLVGSIALLVSYGLSRLVLGRAEAWGLIDMPNARSSHTRQTPKTGGVALALGAAAGVFVGQVLGIASLDSSWIAVLVGALALGILGLADDRWDLGVGRRLAVEFVVATVVMSVILPSEGTTGTVLTVFLAGLLVVAVVGMMNIFNFMDGIDGIAGATGAASAGVWIILDFGPMTTVAGVAVLGGSVGFLLLNWAPAKVFMGDTGSLFLGFLIAATTVRLAVQDPSIGAIAAVPLAPFAADGVLTLIRRWNADEPITEAHRDHCYQRMARKYGHSPVALGYGVLALAMGLAAAGVARNDSEWGAWMLVVAVVASAVAWMGLSSKLE